MNYSFKNVLLASAVTATSLVGVSSYSSNAAAQEAAIVGVEEIIVTARKRDENILNVPVSITALAASELRAANAFGLEDIAQLTPGLNFSTPAGGLAEVNIRGLSQTDISGLIANVGVFIDGIHINNRAAVEFGNMDLAQIEVLKGPQSALFGRDTFAGAINYRTNPALLGEYDATVEGQIGSDELYSIRGSVNVPAGDNFAIRAFGGYSSFDGAIDNLRDGATENVGGWDKRATYGAQAVFEQGPLSVTLFTVTNEVDEDNPATRATLFTNNTGGTEYILDQNGAPISLFTLPAGPQPNIDAVNLDPRGRGVVGKFRMHYGIIDLETDFATISATVSKSKSEYDTLFDNFGDPANFTRPFFGIYTNYFFTNSTGDEAKQDSYELRVASNEDSDIDWQLGYVHFDSSTGGVLSTTTPLLADINTLETITRVEERIVQKIDAIFGAVNIPVSEQLNISAEARYTWDDFSLTDKADIFFLPVFSRPLTSKSANFDYWSGRISADYLINDDVMVYGSVARGVKTGGINGGLNEGDEFFTFQPETNLAFEIGAKGRFLEGRLVANAALFYIDWNDLQSTAPPDIATGTNAAILNGLGNPSSKGIEFDATFDVTEQFQMRLATAYQDPTFGDSFTDVALGTACPENFDPTRVGQTCSSTISDTRLPRTPSFTLFLSGTYTWADIFRGFDAYARADFSHEGKKYLTSQNLANITSINLVNIRGGFENENTEVAFWMDNVFDEASISRAIPITDSSSRNVCTDCGGVRSTRLLANNGRTFGVTVTQRF